MVKTLEVEKMDRNSLKRERKSEWKKKEKISEGECYWNCVRGKSGKSDIKTIEREGERIEEEKRENERVFNVQLLKKE